MTEQSFSKIWVVIILVVFITGGFLAWRYFSEFKIIERIPGGTENGLVAKDKIVKGPLGGISVSFNKQIDGETLNQDTFYALWGIGLKIPGKIEYNESTKTASILFDKELEGGEPGRETRITVIVQGINDFSGNEINRLLYNIDIVKSEAADWKTYINEGYGFEIQYPSGTKIGDIDITGGREVWMQLPYFVGETNLSGEILHIQMVTTQFIGGSEQPASCASDVDTSYVIINGINFNKNNISAEFGGTQSTSTAIEYCALKGNKTFKLVFELSYNRYGQLPNFNIEKKLEIFDQMLATFRFLE